MADVPLLFGRKMEPGSFNGNKPCWYLMIGDNCRVNVWGVCSTSFTGEFRFTGLETIAIGWWSSAQGAASELENRLRLMTADLVTVTGEEST